MLDEFGEHLTRGQIQNLFSSAHSFSIGFGSGSGTGMAIADAWFCAHFCFDFDICFWARCPGPLVKLGPQHQIQQSISFYTWDTFFIPV